MSWPCISIAAPLKIPWPMKTWSRTRIAGVVIPRAVKRPGKSSANGCGTRLLELGQQLAPKPVRTTEFAPALSPAQQEATNSPSPSQGYGPAEVALPWKAGRFSGRDFALQPDGTLRCPGGQSLVANARRTEADGSLRVVYAASIRSCRPCPLREQCQWHGRAATKPRRVSVLLHPLLIGSAPLLVARTGAGGLIDARVCNSCATNASKCRSSRPARPARMAHLRPFPVHSGLITDSRGKSGWLAMRASPRLAR
jgi:hypothetical protein